ncbi:hypothetical protein AB0N05_34345 [Nocardia sp. NPDC051030]|uniref:hypothetical protein n=1 Tax=Nocardia sp. NPDC051030 TaxID=3155162 RepID=UPI00342401AA
MKTRIETIVDTDNGVQISHVRLDSPLPPGFPECPAGLGELGYLRYRLVAGPSMEDADAILVMQPGTWAGAQSMDRLARNVVRRAAAHGRSIEWWSLSRRSEGATDRAGIHAAYAAGDPTVAIDYYFGRKSLNGKVFEGFRRGDDLRFLAELGLQQVVLDQHEVLTRELPDPDLRRAKVFCGGHSLGGLLAGAYAAWDLDGRPGHDQCAGLIAIDTLVSPDPLGLGERRWGNTASKAADRLHSAILSGLRRGAIPRATPLGATTMAQFATLVHILGLAAACHGDTETDVHLRLPRTPGWELFLRLPGARRYRDLLRTDTSIRALDLTGEALLGLIAGQPFDVLLADLGTLDGPTLPRTTFPVPPAAHRLPGLGRTLRALFGSPTSSPTDPTARYRWKPGGSGDLPAIAHQLATGPLSTFETYFPMRIHYDLWTALAGARTADLADYRHAETASTLPTLHALSDPARFVPEALRLTGLTPPSASYAPGYGHLDMVTATDHPTEPVTTAFTNFLLEHVPTREASLLGNPESA